MKKIIFATIILVSLVIFVSQTSATVSMNADWKARTMIRIDNAQLPIDSDLNGFRMLVTQDNLPSEMFDPNSSYHAKADGCDIRFSLDTDGLYLIPFEIEHFYMDMYQEGSDARIWVKLPGVYKNVPTDIYVWYANPNASCLSDSDFGSTYDVWGSDYFGVYHFSRSTYPESLTPFDSTENQYFAEVGGNLASLGYSSAKIGDGLVFDGIGDSMSIYGIDNQGTQSGTISFWYQGIPSQRSDFGIVTSDASNTSDANGLLGHWTFDEGFNDSSSYTRIATASSTATTTTNSKFGSGAGDFYYSWAIFDPSPSLNTQDITVSAWIKADIQMGGGTIVSTIDQGMGGFNFLIDSTGHLVLEVAGDGYYDIVSSNTIEFGIWQHVMVTLKDFSSGGTGVNFYINGRAEATGQSAPLYYSGDPELMIGQYFMGGDYQSYFVGQIDELMIYNRQLSPFEAFAEYLGPLSVFHYGNGMFFRAGAQTISFPGYSISDGYWHYFTGAYGSNGIAVFIDGQMMNYSPLATIYPHVNSLYIASDPEARNSLYYSGYIDELRYASRALTADEIKMEYFGQNNPASFSGATNPVHLDATTTDITNDYIYNEDHHTTPEVQPGAVAPSAISSQTVVPLFDITSEEKEKLKPEELEKLKFNFTINDGATKTTTRDVILKFMNISDVVVNMAISEDSEFKFASIEPYQQTKILKLSETYGTKNIYVKFYNASGVSSDPVMQTIEYIKAVSGDINQDGFVDLLDFNILMNDWGQKDSEADLNGDGAVDLFDLNILMGAWK